MLWSCGELEVWWRDRAGLGRLDAWTLGRRAGFLLYGVEDSVYPNFVSEITVLTPILDKGAMSGEDHASATRHVDGFCAQASYIAQ